MKQLIIALFLILLAGSAEAVTRYVDPVCPNAITIYNPTAVGPARCAGGSATVYTTFDNGIAALVAGDTLLMRAGTYNTYLDTRPAQKNASAVSGTSGNPITIAAYPGNCATPGTVGPGGVCENVTFRPTAKTEYILMLTVQNWIFDGLRLNASAAYGGVNASSNNTFKNMDVFNMNVDNTWPTEGGIGVFIPYNSIGVLIDNTKIHDATSNPGPFGLGPLGLYWQGSSSTLQNSEVYNLGGMGMQLYCNVSGDTCTGAMSNNTVQNTKVYNTGFIGGFGTTGIEVRSQPGALPHRILNNIVYGNSGRGIGISSGGGASHFIYNNTVYGNQSAGISLSSGTAHQIKNNIAWGNGIAALTDFYDDGVGGAATANNNLCSTISGSGFGSTPCSVTSNPLFVSAGSDFHLQAGSPAINAGTTNIAPGLIIPACSGGVTTYCYNGTAPDIGALETGVPTAGGGPPTLVANLTSVAAGQEIKVTVDDDDVNERTENTGDYVGLYIPGAASTAFVDWFYMNNTKSAPATPISDAVLTFTAPATQGTYEFRFYQNGSTLEADRLATATFTVVPVGIVMKFSVSSLKIGPSVTWKVGTP